MLTSSQQKAVNIINKNLVVNAGAGSGKTRVLVERYINILENGNLDKGKEVDSIVAITFTKKAQSEMKDRIRKKLSDKISKDLKWKRIYEDIDKANISTIHGFCSKILMENPIEARIYPDFKILEEYKKIKYITEILENIFMKGVEKQEYIYNFLQYFTLFSIDETLYSENIITTLKKIYLKIRTTGMDINEVRDITLSNIDNIDINIDKICSIKKDILYLIDNSTKNSKLFKLKEDDIWINFYNSDYEEINEDLIFQLSYIKKNLGKNKKLQDYLDNVEEDINSVLMSIEKMNRNIYIAIFDILIELDRQYSLKKKEETVLDFEDLQILTLRLLDNKDVLEYYQNKYKYIMVDEFQDTDNLQKSILYKLCSKNSKLDRNNLFIVGDPKQSIYRFRGADLSVFEYVSNDIVKNSDKLLISLDDNFRTVDTIMKFINDFFIKLMKNKYKELKSNKKSFSDIDVEILKKDDIEIPEGQSPSEFHKKYEGELIARRIKQLVKDGRYDYRDIAILFRTSTNIGNYEEKLKKYSIPYSNISGGGLFENQEIIDIINVLKVIDNKYDYIALVGFLRSPMIGVSDETLYWIFKNKYNNVLDNLLNIDIDDIEKEKIKRVYEIINKFNKLKNILNVKDIIKGVLRETKYIEKNMLLFGNIQKMSNIYKFIEFAKEIEYKEKLELNEFLRYIENSIKYGKDISQAKIGNSQGNTVNIMTIHKSKGLQFKVIIIPETAKIFKQNNSTLLFNKDEGLGIKHPDSKGKPSKELSPIFTQLLDIDKKEELEENKRILYVAMTRTEEKLILGCQTIGKKYKNSFKNMIEKNIPKENIKYIENIDMKEEKVNIVRNLNKEHLNIKKMNSEMFSLFNDKNHEKNHLDSFSISQFMTFKQCKRNFYYSYYKNLPINKFNNGNEDNKENRLISPTDKGLIVHRICELYDENTLIIELMNRVLKEYNIPLDEEIINDIKPYVDNYIKENDFNVDKSFKEVKFQYNIGLFKITGVIDRINIREGEAEIIDFKTNKIDNRKYLIEKYGPQIQLYTSVVQDLFNVKMKRAGLMLLKSGEFVDVDISKKSLKENIKEIKEFILFINSYKDINDYDKNGKECRYCKYNSKCYKRTNILN
ncbi:UvrD-helicase domain-containing protein [Clostridium sp. D2Q-14]|uniref:UvrD-helicase domain-containing protein n=1 Tax=Anaeromonas gelatinilytica TaxID=2683194 RepID=UPI00193C7AA6|nr:UvrD-helicase domain-containing protein [Anaeromonas gelatinilytica]MBS4536750.1 UvrD-helicase domain-containing protein [Anaeromonas gelatinilytica]